MENAEKVTVRLTPEIIVALKVLVDRGDFESMSDAVRKAIEELISSRFTAEEIDMMVPEISIEFDDSGVDSECEIEAMNKAIHDAVTGFVRAKMEARDEDTEGKKDEESEE